MNTDQLIDRLVADTRPIGAGAVSRRLAVGALLGLVVSFAVIPATIGTRPDLASAVATPAFWMKLCYTLSIAAVAMGTTARLARPEPGGLRRLSLLALPVALLAIIGATELSRATPAEEPALWLGASWRQCPWIIASLAAPIFAGLLWSFRRLAPARPGFAGATAGLTAGSIAASAYCLHCPETSALFVLTWYSLGILLAAVLGAMIGPKLLRW